MEGNVKSGLIFEALHCSAVITRVTVGDFEIDFLTKKSVGERNEWIIDVDALPVLGGSPLDNFDLFERVHAEFLLVVVAPFFLSKLQPVGSLIIQS